MLDAADGVGNALRVHAGITGGHVELIVAHRDVHAARDDIAQRLVLVDVRRGARTRRVSDLQQCHFTACHHRLDAHVPEVADPLDLANEQRLDITVPREVFHLAALLLNTTQRAVSALAVRNGTPG